MAETIQAMASVAYMVIVSLFLFALLGAGVGVMFATAYWAAKMLGVH